MLRRVTIIGAAIMLLTVTTLAQEGVQVTMQSGNLREAITYRQVMRLVSEYTLYNWLFTTDVHISENSLPRSHPRLTLNTKYFQDDHKALAVFLQQQVRWHLAQKESRLDEAITDLMKRPDQLIEGITQDLPNDSLAWRNLFAMTLELVMLEEVTGLSEIERLYTWRVETSRQSELYQAAWKHKDAVMRQVYRFRFPLPTR